MKFDCGETLEEEYARKTQWHRWFAWYPVTLSDHDCWWLEYVERKQTFYSGSIVYGWRNEYRSLK